MTNSIDRLAFVGFGEAGTAFIGGWGADRPANVSAFDIKTDDEAAREEMWARYAAHDVSGATTSVDALRGAGVVFSVVTADQALAAAEAAAGALSEGALWFDCNSCAPDTKRRAAAIVEAAGGRYVDVAVMAPVYPARHQVPLLISGPHAETSAEVLASLEMKPEIAGQKIGQASSIKMIRSVMIKGVEALTAECFLAARRAGVEDCVIASLDACDPAAGWRRRAAYNLERMTTHGVRRAAEMREVAATVQELGFSGGMAAAAADWQALLGALDANAGGNEEDLAVQLDTILSRL